MNSKFLSLNMQDFIKGLLVAVLTAVLTAVYNTLDGGTSIDWKTILTVGITAGIGYLLKNLGSNSEGKLVKKEKSDQDIPNGTH